MRKSFSLAMLVVILVGTFSYSLKILPVQAVILPADAVQSNPLSINWTYPTHAPGETFTVYVDVINVVDLFAYQAGFRFDPTALRVLSVEAVAFPPGYSIPVAGTIDQTNGVVTVWASTLIDPAYALSGSGHLLRVTMQINPSLSPPYSGAYPGTPVPMINLTDADGDPCELKLYYKDGISEITPTYIDIHDGSFSLSVIRGDINYDGRVDILDASQLALYWRQTVPPAPIAVDVNRDGVVDIQDAALIGLNWQKHG